MSINYNKNSIECRKFKPNIFNKNKCSDCFKDCLEHSKSALDNCRASRKISKCGYLFVAPDWDFTNPLYRTKKWQRRWFILYDDGELTYSIDEQPDTVPQAKINMNQVIEVNFADEITGQLNSIAIKSVDHVTYLKGNCSEESKWWYNILHSFPSSRNRIKQQNLIHSSFMQSSKSQQVQNKQSMLIENVSHSEKLQEITNIITNKSKNIVSRWSDAQYDEKPDQRGDPDGGDCNLDGELSLLLVDNNAELESHDILNSKRGWLMKLNPITSAWSKYWFCLKGGGLFYYRDPTAEKRGVLDGILDVNSLTEIKEVFSTRDNSFQLKTYDNKKIILSASTEKIKCKWIATIELAAGLTVTTSTENLPTTTTPTTATILGANNNNNLCQTCDEKPITSNNNNNNNNVLLESNNSQVKSISKFSANECLKTKKTKNVNMAKKSNNIELSENNHNNNKNKELKVERKKAKKSSLTIESTNKDIASSSDDEYKTASSSNSNSAELNRLYLLSTTKPKETNLLAHQEKNELADDETDGKKIHRFDSFSDLTSLSDIDPKTLSKTNLVDEYDELKQRFAKLVNELKTMKRELRDSYSSYDSLDIAYTALKQEFERKRIESNSRIKMMADRIQDLATKYSNAEKQLRVLKQKLIKSERKRTLSLKGKDAIQKEVEGKVHELEEKIDCVDGEILSPTIGSLRASPARGSTPERKTSNYKHRRKSLESVSNQPFQLLVRLNALEKRIENTSSSSSSLTTKQNEDHVKQLENTIIMCRNTIEQGINQFQLKSSRNSDTTELIKVLVKSLLDANKILTDGNGNNSEINPVNSDIEIFDQNPVKIALHQLESQLTTKLGDLLKQRRLLRETNQLTCKKDLELLAERIAFESVCFGKLRDSLNRSEKPENFAEHHVKCEVSEIAQLMVTLKSKLCGKPFKKINSSFDILSNVLAKRLFLTSERLTQDGFYLNANSSIEADSNIVEDLLRQQHELNVIVKRYKSTTIENLAYDLAIDAINYISTNDTIQSVVQDTWRQAQETVSAELIQSEISQVMMKTAKRYEDSIGPSTGFAITHQERMNFEILADMVQTMLRHEMEVAAGQLTQCFQETLEKIKQGQWHTHLGEERRISEGRQILIEFADVIAHKTLIDARIAFIREDHNPSTVDIKEEKCQEKLNLNCLALLQKYENLFSELSDDLSVNNADDVLLEADFNFLFQHFTAQFSLDKQEFNDLSNIIMKLEDTIIKLHNKLNPEANINQIQNLNLENIKNIAIKLNQFHEILESALDQATIQCNECEKMQDAIIDMSQQHDDELNELNQKNSTMHVEIEGLLEKIRELGRDKTELTDKLNNEINLVKIHEKEIQELKSELNILERNCQNKSVENEELVKKLNDTNGDLLKVKKTVETMAKNLQQEQLKMREVAQDYENLIEQVNKERESTKELENQLEMVEFEYKSKVDQLNQYYQKKLAIELDNKAMKEQEEENLCQKYQEEIEHLRVLCEKGLNAMENSHKKIIAEMEERHQEEIQRMLAEKETALAEETQATLYALDAMRKVHQSEVQKEVERFKQEFIFHFNNNHKHLDTITLQKEKELEEVRQEILSLSEKYSMKCVETISLEEKLKQMEQKLKMAELSMQQMELKNNDDRDKSISSSSSSRFEFHPRFKLSSDGYGMSSISKPQSPKVSIDETTTPTSSRATNPSNSKDDDAIIKSFELEI